MYEDSMYVLGAALRKAMIVVFFSDSEPGKNPSSDSEIGNFEFPVPEISGIFHIVHDFFGQYPCWNPELGVPLETLNIWNL